MRHTQYTCASLLLIMGGTIALSSTTGLGQGCGTVVEPAAVPLILHRQLAGLYNPPALPEMTQHVAIAFHVVRRSNGTGGLPLERVVRALDDANVHFANAGIQFCWNSPLDYIDSDEFYFNIDTQEEIDALRSTNVVPNAVNVYFTQNLAVGTPTGPLPLCGISSFTWSAVQGIVMSNDCTATATNRSTFSHELGHYLDLLHTHETALGSECVSNCGCASNCSLGGDLLCDTPADPTLGTGNVNTACQYTGSAQDCAGAVYAPMPTNLMSYSRAQCRTLFTNQQNFRMRAALQALRANHLVTCSGQNMWRLDGKLLAADGLPNDIFGFSAAVAGDTAVIGAPLVDGPGQFNRGAAYVFRNVNGIWTQHAKLMASDGQAGDSFGRSVALSGDTAAIGADGVLGARGAVYIFRNVNGVWTQQAKLLASDNQPNDVFGFSVTIEGDTAVFGAYGADQGGTDRGAAYVFRNVNGLWSQHAKLVASDGANGDRLGLSVALSGDTAMIGAPGVDLPGQVDRGAAYVFRNLNGLWTQQAKLLAADGIGGDGLGVSVALAGDSAVVGADGADTPGLVNRGAAYIFRNLNGVWSQQAKLLATDGLANDWFGRPVALAGDTTVIGAIGVDSPGQADSGAAYIFRNIGGAWVQQSKLLASDGAANDWFGRHVALAGDTAVIGAYAADVGGQMDRGAVYVFKDLNLLRFCYADCNGDEQLNLADFGCFQTRFALNDPYSDCNGDGALNLADFGCFQTKFALGCP